MLRSLDRHSEAAGTMRNALAMNAWSAELLREHAAISEQCGEFAHARATLEQARAIAPLDAASARALVKLCASQRRFDDAEARARSAARRIPRSSEPLRELG
jgi:Flp pilus assembly protein TadD